MNHHLLPFKFCRVRAVAFDATQNKLRYCALFNRYLRSSRIELFNCSAMPNILWSRSKSWPKSGATFIVLFTFVGPIGPAKNGSSSRQGWPSDRGACLSITRIPFLDHCAKHHGPSRLVTSPTGSTVTTQKSGLGRGRAFVRRLIGFYARLIVGRGILGHIDGLVFSGRGLGGGE